MLNVLLSVNAFFPISECRCVQWEPCQGAPTTAAPCLPFGQIMRPKDLASSMPVGAGKRKSGGHVRAMRALPRCAHHRCALPSYWSNYETERSGFKHACRGWQAEIWRARGEWHAICQTPEANAKGLQPGRQDRDGAGGRKALVAQAVKGEVDSAAGTGEQAGGAVYDTESSELGRNSPNDRECTHEEFT